MVNHRVDASHGEFPGEDRGIRGNSPDPTGTESHSERARQLHWKKIYADHPMLTVGVPIIPEGWVGRLSGAQYSILTQLFTKSLPCFPYDMRRTFVMITFSFLPRNSSESSPTIN